jgi:hypothetical protein
MSRASVWIGFLAGGWLATILVIALPALGLRTATAEDPPASGQPVPVGPSVNPIGGGTGPRGMQPVPGGGTSDSNNHAIALAASIGGGQSVVYYFDTLAKRLLVFQYAGIIQGSKPLEARDKGGLRLLAARHFDYDLRLEGYRDLSQRTRNELKTAFEDAFGDKGDDGVSGLPPKKVDLPGGFK